MDRLRIAASCLMLMALLVPSLSLREIMSFADVMDGSKTIAELVSNLVILSDVSRYTRHLPSVAFLACIAHCYACAAKRPGRPLRYSAFWTIATLAVPLVNLVRPWLGLFELAYFLDERLRADGSRRVACILRTGLLWIAFVLAFYASVPLASTHAPRRMPDIAKFDSELLAWHETAIRAAAFELGLASILVLSMIIFVWPMLGQAHRIAQDARLRDAHVTNSIASA